VASIVLVGEERTVATCAGAEEAGAGAWCCRRSCFLLLSPASWCRGLLAVTTFDLHCSHPHSAAAAPTVRCGVRWRTATHTHTVALTQSFVYLRSCAPQAVSDCELSPLCRHTLASPAAMMRVKVVIAKVFVMVCAVAINVSEGGVFGANAGVRFTIDGKTDFWAFCQ